MWLYAFDNLVSVWCRSTKQIGGITSVGYDPAIYGARVISCAGRQALLPDETPRGPFDLIVASEIAYYLRPTALSRLLSQLETALAPGGRIVFLHHVRPFDDAALPHATAQARIRARFNAMQLVFQKRDRGFDAVAFCKPAYGKAVRRGAPGHHLNL
jgi:SAM-dependent methyltransferase